MLTGMTLTTKRRHRRNFNIPGDAHALTYCCYHGYQFLRAERTCVWLKEAIDEARLEFDFALWAYVFMPEHVHLIVWPRLPVYDIADIRQALKEPVGREALGYLSQHAPHWLPRLTRQRGQKTERLFWQSGGGYDRNIKSAKALVSRIEYIHLNPVRRGLVTKAVDWKWSSAAWYELGQRGPIWIDPIPPQWLESDDQA
jgi:putative transposase